VLLVRCSQILQMLLLLLLSGCSRNLQHAKKNNEFSITHTHARTHARMHTHTHSVLTKLYIHPHAWCKVRQIAIAKQKRVCIYIFNT
jgi:hypothetical protein